MGVIEQLQRASAARPKSVVEQLQAASDPTLGQMAQQAASSFVEGAFDSMHTAVNAGQRIQNALPAWMGGASLGPEQQGSSTAPLVQGVPGQEDRLYAQAAGMAGASLPLAPAAMGGPVGLGIAGAGLGAEQGIEAAQQAGATPSDTVYSALGNALIGATQAFGPAKALTRFGIKPGTAAHFLVTDMLTAAGQGAVQSAGSDIVAGATYDPERVVDLGKALETAMASMGASGAMGGTVKVLETAAKLRTSKAAAPEASAQETGNLATPVEDATTIAPDQTTVKQPPLAQEPAPSQTTPTSVASTEAASPPLAPPATVHPEAGAGGVSVPPEPTPAAPVEALKQGERAATPLTPGKGDELTGIKHASTEADREVLGLLEREGRTPKKDADILARARAELEADPLAGQKVVEARERDGRQLNDEEGMLVALELTRIKNERDAAEEAHIADPSPETKARIEAARAAYDRTATLAETSGSEQGAAFRMRRALLKRDYSLAAMERTIEVAKGAPLSEQDIADIKAWHERLAKAEADVAELQSKAAEEDVQRQFEGLKREVQGRARSSVRQQRVAQNKARMDAILSELADTRAFAGVDPTKLVKVVEFAKLAIENGALKFADFAEQILKAGEHVKPYLEQAWKQAQEERRKEFAAKVAERQKEGGTTGRYINEIAKSLIESGVTEREPLIDELHAILKTVDPTMTREEARDALSGYGKFREASKEEADVTLRQLKQEMQKVAQIEALEKKAAPLKTGFDRGEPSDEYRRLTKKANELRKQLDIKTVDPERQLKTVLEADRRRLENQISDLQYEIEHKTRIVRERGEHPTTPEIESLKKQRDDLKDQRDELFKADTDAARVATAMRNVEKSIADYEQRIAAGDIARREGKPGPTSPELEAMRARRDALKATLDEMREAAKPKPTPAELQARKDAASIKSYMTRKANEIARLKERQAREDFGPAPKKERILTPPEIAKKAEHEKARQEFERKKLEYEKAHRTKLEKVRDAAKEVLDLPKSIFSSFDVSAVGRQGAVLSGSDALLRPMQLTSRIGRMFRALTNEDYALRVDTEIRNHPLYAEARKAGLELTGHNDSLTPREEIFKSHLAEKIPILGKGVQASERAYSTYLNLLRFDHFRRLVAATNGSPKAAKALANFINVATGRGNVGKGKFAATVNAAGSVLWAPRLYVSRFQLLLGQPLVGGTARTRALILREYATSLAALASVYTLVGLIPDDEDKVTVSSDSTSADFGKIKIGNTRIDPLAGLSQTARLISREAVALSQGAESKENAAEIAFTFLKTKFSPSITVPYELAFEKGFAYGEKKPRPATVGDAVKRMAPLSFQDTLDAMKEQGVPEGLALGILSMFGVGLNTYEKKK